MSGLKKNPPKKVWLVGSLWGEEWEHFVFPSKKAALAYKAEEAMAEGEEGVSGPFPYERVES